ncbi:MAG: hypothetical protein Q8R39_02525 [bacterium]|nr:hypothetical protein [bacterium]MDZ4284962.1 hypothetical protein [Patescibacteria group bacterium]
MKFYERSLFWTCVLAILGGFIGWAVAESPPDPGATAGAWIRMWFLVLLIHITLGFRGVRYDDTAFIAGEVVGFLVMARTPIVPFAAAPYDALLAGTIITATVLLAVLFNLKCLPVLYRWGHFA